MMRTDVHRKFVYFGRTHIRYAVWCISWVKSGNGLARCCRCALID